MVNVIVMRRMGLTNKQLVVSHSRSQENWFLFGLLNPLRRRLVGLVAIDLSRS